MSTFRNTFKIAEASVKKAEELSTLLPPNIQHRQNIRFPYPPRRQSSSHEGQIATSVPKTSM